MTESARLHKALTVIRQLREENSRLKAAAREPIAIVSMACRFPGEANTPEKFWQLLSAGTDPVGPIPTERWDHSRWYSSDPEEPGKTAIREGAFLSGIDQFDAEFFGISTREAERMDPQQRLLLETSWEAIERAHWAATQYQTRTGLFIGAMWNEYSQRALSNLDELDAYVATGAAGSFLTGRLAYHLGTQGPALSIDTACSSSLIAVHLACESLRTQACERALAGGVSVILSPEMMVLMSRLQALSADGRCKTFDAAADGYGRGEGCGVVALRRLSDARRDDESILAVIHGSAYNHNGLGSGLTVPSAKAQREVIRSALRDAGISSRDISFVETHGTGTSLGDPIELRALWSALNEEKEPPHAGLSHPILVSSVKTNINHLEGAAGIASLIKTVLCIQHSQVPPHLHLKTLNPKITAENLPFVIPNELTDWTPQAEVRLAGISSFGLSGINCHMIVGAETQSSGTVIDTQAAPALDLLCLSAKTSGALSALIDRYGDWLTEHLTVSPNAVCRLANTGRDHFEHRVAVSGSSVVQLRDRLLQRRQSSQHRRQNFEREAAPIIAWLFPGQGTQFVGMGQELFERWPGFRQTLEELDAEFLALTGESLLQVMWNEPQKLNDTRWTQPALYAIEVALAELWLTWGIEPDYVAGHSVGQFAAATIAGMMSRSDGLRLITQRARLMSSLSSPGAMLAVFASLERVQELIARWESISIAADNGSQVVISGPAASIAVAEAELQRQDILCVRLKTSQAFHSELLEPILDELESFSESLSFQTPNRFLVCNVTGDLFPLDQKPNGIYWRRHAREPVQWRKTVATLAQQGCDCLMEIGPDAVLTRLSDRCWPGSSPPTCLPSLGRGSSEVETVLSSVGALYESGITPRFESLSSGATACDITLPTYPFQRQRYWFDAATTSPASESRVSARNLYSTEWREAPAVDSDPPRSRHWVLLGGPQELTQSLGTALENLQQTVSTIKRLERLESSATKGDIKELTGTDVEPGGIVDLRFLGQSESCPDASLQSLLDVLRSSLGQERTIPLVLVTNGAFPVVPGENVLPEQSMLASAGCVIGLERPQHWRRVVDLPADGNAADLALLAQSICRDSDEEQLAIRSSRVHVQRLDRLAIDTGIPLQLNGEGTYLITGGLGGIGIEFARHLVSCGSKHLTLIGRRAPSTETEQVIADLRQSGCEIHVASVDLSKSESVASFLANVQANSTVKGVIHAAGTSRLIPAEDITAAELDQVLSAKVHGAERLLKGLNLPALDFVVFVSSVASVWGSAQQAHYAAANAFLDATAMELRRQGIRAFSLNYGPWESKGLSEGEAIRSRLQRSGVQLLSPQAALDAFDAAFTADVSRLVVADIDWDQFVATYRTRRSGRLFTKLIASVQNEPPAKQIRDDLLRSGADLREKIQSIVLTVLARVLKTAPARIDRRKGFFQQGMDSLMAVELKKGLEQVLGLALPATLALDAPRAGILTDYLVEKLTESAATDEDATASIRTSTPDEPIAIVGMACRFPGAEDLDEFWDLLIQGQDAITEIPEERWNSDEFFDPRPGTRGRIYTKAGGFLKHIDQFDPEFFRITPREAVSIDPQQRLLLEVSYEALEHAAIPPESIDGTSTGVYVGVGANEYGALWPDNDGHSIDGYFATGNALNAIAGRVAFTLGLQGPAIAVDTACSSSLVAIHQAVQGLRSGDCQRALAGGVNVLLRPDSSIAACEANMLSPAGKCKTFDASADGYVRGEGCGVVVLERLSDAEAAGHTILGIIRGTAVNQDGASGGFTVPHGPAQLRVIQAALKQADLQPGDIDYLEAHGTGTSLGDPIEVQAGATALGKQRPADRPLLIGSVKTNIGHLESAAGISGLIKILLAMDRGTIPAHLNCPSPSPHIPWNDLPVQVVRTAVPWPRENLKRAGVSSFGFSGTNAHLIVEGGSRTPSQFTADGSESGEVLALSARSASALRQLAERYQDWLQRHPEVPIAALCRTAAVGRDHFEVKAAFVVKDAQDALAQLARYLGGGAAATFSKHVPRSEQSPKSAPEQIAAEYLTGDVTCLQGFYSGQGALLHGLPGYPFQRKRYWITDRVSATQASVPRALPLVGLRQDASGMTGYLSQIRKTDQPWLNDHQVYGLSVLPGAAHAALALCLAGESGILREVEFLAPLAILNDSARWFKIETEEVAAGERRFRIVSSEISGSESDWTPHATGKILETQQRLPLPEMDEPVSTVCQRMQPIAVDELFRTFAELGLSCGITYRSSLKSLWLGEQIAIGEIEAGTALKRFDCGEPIHPILLDLCNCITGAFLFSPTQAAVKEVFIPVRYSQIQLTEKVDGRFYCLARKGRETAEVHEFDLLLINGQNDCFGEIRGLSVKRAERNAFYSMSSTTSPRAATDHSRESWLEGIDFSQGDDVIACRLALGLQDLLRELLELEAEPAVDVGFADMGIDSLLAAELRTRTQQFLENRLSLPVTFLYEHANIHALSQHLAELLRSSPGDRPESAAERNDAQHGNSDPDDADLHNMTEDDAERALLKELEEMESSS